MPVVFDEQEVEGIALWDVTAVKGNVLVLLNYAGGPQINPVITIFRKALGKVRGTTTTKISQPTTTTAGGAARTGTSHRVAELQLSPFPRRLGNMVPSSACPPPSGWKDCLPQGLL